MAVSADASRVAAVHQDGTLAVWDLRSQADQPIGVAAAAVGKGPHQLWLSPTGEYAFLADPVSAPALWSLAVGGTPARMLTLNVGADPAVPAMISFDGRIVASIDRAGVLSLWSLTPVVDVIADPTPRACQLADMTEQRWRQLVANPAWPNPCAPTPLPSLGVGGG